MQHRRPDQLSGGQQQRVALARAIIIQPDVLLLDEPLSNLDARLREQMRQEIRKLQQALQITAIYVTHDQLEAMTVSERIVIMEAGRIIQVGTPFEIYSRPVNVFAAEFTGKVNLIQGKIIACSAGRVTVGYSTGAREFRNISQAVCASREVLTLVWPECLQLRVVQNQQLHMPNRQEGKYLLQGKITRSVYTGATVEYEIRTGSNQPLTAVIFNPIKARRLRVGDHVGVNFNAKAAHLIPVA